MREDLPLVSVVLPFLDGHEFLSEAIESVLAQTYQNWELLLFDDGSSAQATSIAKEYARKWAPRLKYLEHEQHANRGLSATRNAAISHADGKYVAFIDADDVWLPDKLAQQVGVLAQNPGVALVCGTVVYWSSWASSADADRRVPTGYIQDEVVRPPAAAFRIYPLGTAHAPVPSDMIVDREVIVTLGGFDQNFTGALQMYEDQVLLAKIYNRERIYCSTNVWTKYRQHPASLVSTVTVGGKYSEVRIHFLTWYQHYLRAHYPENYALRAFAAAALAKEYCRLGLRRLLTRRKITGNKNDTSN